MNPFSIAIKTTSIASVEKYSNSPKNAFLQPSFLRTDKFGMMKLSNLKTSF
jgi:hypothetical protein